MGTEANKKFVILAPTLSARSSNAKNLVIARADYSKIIITLLPALDPSVNLEDDKGGRE
jgi:hypothetical protein